MESNIPQAPLHHEDDDDSPEAMIQRVREMYGIEETNLDELRKLAMDESAGERFDVFLDDLTYEVLANNEEFNENRRLMMSGKLSKHAKEEVRDKQRALFSSYRQGIIEEAGLPTESALTEVEKSKQQVRTMLNEVVDNHDTPEPTKALEALGIISHNKKGQEIFTYPRGLFPKSTDNKWDVYLESVKNHLRIERAVHGGTVDKSELGEADTMRRMAHNTVARDVHEILGLDGLEGSNWDFDKTRNLLAKMRDTRFPTVETSEKFVTEDAVLEGAIGLQALKILRAKLSDLHANHDD